VAKAAGRAEVEAGRRFFKRLASEGPWSPVHLITGAERFLAGEAVDRMVRAVFPSGHDDFNLDRLHGADTDGDTITRVASTLPMFAPRRVVLVRGAEQLAAGDWDTLAAWAEDPPESTLLILSATSVNGRWKGVKAFRKHAGVDAIDFPELRERDAAGWTARRARHHNLVLGREVPDYLVEAVGTSLQQLELALERIDLFLGDGDAPRNVTRSDIEVIVPDVRTRTVFELIDLLADRKLDRAVADFHAMLEHGASAVGTVSMVAMQFRRIWKVREAARARLGASEIARAAGIPPFTVDRYRASARRFDDAELRRILRLVRESDQALKSSRLRDELIVERLFASICLGSDIASLPAR
jgi:DNA polymerase-3 subunit delta